MNILTQTNISTATISQYHNTTNSNMAEKMLEDMTEEDIAQLFEKEGTMAELFGEEDENDGKYPLIPKITSSATAPKTALHQLESPDGELPGSLRCCSVRSRGEISCSSNESEDDMAASLSTKLRSAVRSTEPSYKISERQSKLTATFRGSHCTLSNFHSESCHEHLANFASLAPTSPKAPKSGLALPPRQSHAATPRTGLALPPAPKAPGTKERQQSPVKAIQVIF